MVTNRRNGRKENRTLQTLQRLVRLFVPELIGQSKCRRLLADLQAKRARNGLIGWRVFLPTTKAKQFKKEKYGHRNFHLEFAFFLVQSSTPKTRQSDESSQKPKGYTPVSNSRKFLYLGSRRALPRLLDRLVTTDKNLSAFSGNFVAKTPSHPLFTF
jgi:hypothetical protein